MQEFRSWSGSPVGLDCARVGNKQLGDLFEEGLHICCGRVSQILNQNQVVSTLFEGALTVEIELIIRTRKDNVMYCALENSAFLYS